MPTNWIKEVDRVNREKYQIPAGWETREQVAAALGCAVDRVEKMLEPGIRSGEFEKDTFPVWDDHKRHTVNKVCYRKAVADKPAAANPAASNTPNFEAIHAAIVRYPNYADHKIASNLYHRGVRSAHVAAVRAQMNSLTSGRP